MRWLHLLPWLVQSHMEKVHGCVELLRVLFTAVPTVAAQWTNLFIRNPARAFAFAPAPDPRHTDPGVFSFLRE